MPELPEVETVKRVVEPQIKGKRILHIKIENPQVIEYPDSDKFVEMIEGSTVTGMFRRGKFLGIDLEDKNRIVLHFRMTGSLIVAPKGYPIEKHTHVIMELDDGNEIRYIDPRRFGRLWFLGEEEDTYTRMDRLGLEPFDNMLTREYLIDNLGQKKKKIKECLLDQSVVTGIGNIYADEILFECKINPTKKACELLEEEWIMLAEKIPEVLSYFIDKNAISKEDYLAGKGKDYRNTPYLKVYGHDGEPCPICGENLCKVVITGRSSVYCPSCQK